MLSAVWAKDKFVREAQNVISTFSLLLLFFFRVDHRLRSPILVKMYYQLFSQMYKYFIQLSLR